MCGRYVLGGDPADYAAYLGADRIVGSALSESYNVAPTDPVYVAAEWDDERLLGVMRWGFVPHWARTLKSIQINARAETIATKPLFRNAFAKKRCLIPADGFYEWEPKERGRIPHWVYREDGRPMVFAGIYSSVRNLDKDRPDKDRPDREDQSGRENQPDGKDRRGDEDWIRTVAIITTEAKGRIANIHHRMPIALTPDVWDAWLDRDLTDPAEIEGLLISIDPDVIVEHPVSSQVNSVRNNYPSLRTPAEPETLF